MNEAAVRELKELAEKALDQTWAGAELPFGPGVTQNHRQNVAFAKELAQAVVPLAEDWLRLKAIEEAIPFRSGGMTKHDDPGNVWVRFNAEEWDAFVALVGGRQTEESDA